MVYLNKIIKFISSHQTLSKALLLIVLLGCLWMLYGPKKFEYLCPVQEIQSCTIYEDSGTETREIILTKEQENELIALLSEQYFRRVVFQNAPTPTRPNRHFLLISFWCDDEAFRPCLVVIDSLGYIHGYGVKSSKKYEGVFLPWHKKELYNDMISIMEKESLYWRIFR